MIPPVVAAPPVAQAPASTAGKALSLEGEIEVEVADFPDRSSVIYHFFKRPSGERHALRFKDDRPLRLHSGAKYRVKGRLSDNVLTAEASPVPLEAAPAEVVPIMPYAAGVQKTAVLLVNFQDKASVPQTPAAVQSLVFGQVNNFYLENSFQTTSISGTVLGWYTLPISSTSCNRSAIKSYALSAAATAGVDLSTYSRFIYLFPNTAACSWAGYGSIGGNPTDAWINGYFDRRIIAHELGHNLGLHHAHSEECGAAAIGDNCSISEYGDLIDTMGWGLYGHFSAYQKESLGWLNFGAMPPITTVQSSGSYALAPYATGSAAPKALKILKETDPATGEKSWYYLEYRQPLGLDNVLAGTGNLTTGVTVRIGSDLAGGLLLDMTPGSDTSSEYNDLKDAALGVGRTFSDAAAGVAFTVTRADSTGAMVSVVLGGNSPAPCVRAKPSVLLSPSQGILVAAGAALSYSVAVSNNDSASCGASSFNLGKTLPNGWAGALGTTSLNIGAGSTASTSLALTSAATALAGTYSLGVSATNGTSLLGASGSASYNIGTPLASTLSETVMTGQWTYSRGSLASATATVKNNGVLLPNATVTFKMTKSNGDLVYATATTGSTGQALFQYPSSLSDPKGAYRIGATASSNGMTVYTSASFTLQ